ncbi:MAG TPA: hypothetical protein VK177_08875 [Flavobacteriales bacterium]|nr:hypothetical protein [Flavobacteriales bacterium]
MLSSKTLVALLGLCFATTFTKAAETTNPVKSNHVFIEPTAPRNALIIKAVTDCTVQVVNENGLTVYSGKIVKGVNEVSLKNLPAATYKLLINGTSFRTERTLSIR